jgi:hypothetical protein
MHVDHITAAIARRDMASIKEAFEHDVAGACRARNRAAALGKVAPERRFIRQPSPLVAQCRLANRRAGLRCLPYSKTSRHQARRDILAEQGNE